MTTPVNPLGNVDRFLTDTYDPLRSKHLFFSPACNPNLRKAGPALFSSRKAPRMQGARSRLWHGTGGIDLGATRR